ncbi:MAG: HAD family phosphatase [Acidobacteria bacterium]|nr:HAD family phosphatase [Acidobacteriota bacterium]MDW7983243.1 HAD family phosphatase [Acidobacteriota bacterium]
MLKAIAFDFNGVLIDDEAVHYQLIRDLVAPLGIVVTEADYLEKYVVYRDDDAFRQVLTDAGRPATPDLVERLVQEKQRRYLEAALRNLRVCPGVPAFIPAVAAAYPLAVVSGAARAEIEAILGHIGLRSYFRVIVGAEDVAHGKPAPDAYVEAVRRLRTWVPDLRPAEVLAIEDTPGGLLAARQAGLRTAAVLTTFPAEALRDADLILWDGLERFPWVQVHLLFEQTEEP